MRIEYALLMVIWSSISFSLDNASFASPKRVEGSAIFLSLTWRFLWSVEQRLQLSRLLFVPSDDDGSFCVYSWAWKGSDWSRSHLERSISLLLEQARNFQSEIFSCLRQRGKLVMPPACVKLDILLVCITVQSWIWQPRGKAQISVSGSSEMRIRLKESAVICNDQFKWNAEKWTLAQHHKLHNNVRENLYLDQHCINSHLKNLHWYCLNNQRQEQLQKNVKSTIKNHRCLQIVLAFEETG